MTLEIKYFFLWNALIPIVKPPEQLKADSKLRSVNYGQAPLLSEAKLKKTSRNRPLAPSG
jgi:hypothetical protein